MIARLTESFDFHSQALSLRAERQRLIAGNIANADTPASRPATSNSPRPCAPPLAVPARVGHRRRGHDPGWAVRPALRYAVPSQTNLDSNTVDMDRERAAFADNAVKYESTLRFINGSVRTLLDAMKSHHQG